MTRARDISNVITDANLGGTLDVSGAFTSQGIDDNADSTSITIDSSENVLIGMTSDASNTVGIRARSEGLLTATRDGSQSAIFGRKSSNGDIVLIQKDGTTVGSVGYVATGQYIQGETDHSGIRFGGNQLIPFRNGADTDATTDLGATSVRYRNLYLSGGAFLGGTGSANQISDYEEGTFTPAYNLATGSSTAIGKYTKIGNMVIINIKFSGTQTSSTTALGKITGLPFTIHETCGNLTINTREFATTGKHLHANLNSNTTESFTFTDASNGATFGAGAGIGFGFTFAYAIQGS